MNYFVFKEIYCIANVKLPIKVKFSLLFWQWLCKGFCSVTNTTNLFPISYVIFLRPTWDYLLPNVMLGPSDRLARSTTNRTFWIHCACSLHCFTSIRYGLSWKTWNRISRINMKHSTWSESFDTCTLKTKVLNQHFKEFGQWQLFIKLGVTFKTVELTLIK